MVDSFLDYDLCVPRIGEGGEPPYQCPNCDDETLVEPAQGEFRCFGCGQTFAAGTIAWCSNCDRPFVNDGETLICSSCIRYKLGADD
jgi:hypothetical protein